MALSFGSPRFSWQGWDWWTWIKGSKRGLVAIVVYLISFGIDDITLATSVAAFIVERLFGLAEYYMFEK